MLPTVNNYKSLIYQQKMPKDSENNVNLNSFKPKFINDADKLQKRKNVALVSSVFGLGAVLTTLLALSKVKNSKMFDMQLKEKEVFALGTSTIVGATLGGCLADDKKNRKAKINEAVHQIIGNVATPLAFMYFVNSGYDKLNFKMPAIKGISKTANVLNAAIQIIPRFIVSCASLWCGINIGNKLANKVGEAIFGENHKARNVKTADYCVHIDDPLTALTIADKSGSLRAFTGKVMPFVFMLSGYEAAMAEE